MTTTTSGDPAATSVPTSQTTRVDGAADGARNQRLGLHCLERHQRSAGRDAIACAHKHACHRAVQRCLDHERALGQIADRVLVGGRDDIERICTSIELTRFLPTTPLVGERLFTTRAERVDTRRVGRQKLVVLGA